MMVPVKDNWTEEQFKERFSKADGVFQCSWGVGTIKKKDGGYRTIIVFYDQDKDKTKFVFDVGSDDEAAHLIKCILDSRLEIRKMIAGK